MEQFGVTRGFALYSSPNTNGTRDAVDVKTKARVEAWEKETGLKLEDSKLPEPHHVFKCRNGTLVSFNDVLLAGKSLVQSLYPLNSCFRTLSKS
jgi:hypothetical protein